MKLQDFKEFLSERYWIIKTNIKLSLIEAKEDYFKNITFIFTPFVFSLVTILFIQVIFKKINIIAGYDKNEMLFFTFISQLQFYIMWFWSKGNIETLENDVIEGNLDLVLNKPLPSLFYLTFKRFDFIVILRDAIPSLLVLIIIIQWDKLNLVYSNILVGITILFLGQIIIHCFSFIFSVLMVFYEIRAITLLSDLFISDLGQKIPYEGYPNPYRQIVSSILPIGAFSAIAISVMLNKSDPLTSVIYVFLLSCVFIYLKIRIWKNALKVYSSASS